MTSLTFNSSIRFVYFFFKWYEIRPNFIAVDLISLTLFIEETVLFFILWFWNLWGKKSRMWMHGFILELLLFCSCSHLSFFMPMLCCFGEFSFVMNFEIRECTTYIFVFYVHICFSSSSLWFHFLFFMACSHSSKISRKNTVMIRYMFMLMMLLKFPTQKHAKITRAQLPFSCVPHPATPQQYVVLLGGC